MDILWYIHWLAPISIVLLPMLPNKILKYIFWYPIIYYFIWIFFDGCPLNKYHKTKINGEKSDEFLLPMFRKYVYQDISVTNFNRIVSIVMSFSIVISSYKLLRNCKLKM